MELFRDMVYIKSCGKGTICHMAFLELRNFISCKGEMLYGKRDIEGRKN